MAKKQLKEIVKDKDNQILMIINLMVFPKFRKAMIKTVIKEEYQVEALEAWETLTYDEKLEWIKDIAIPQFNDGEVEKFLITGSRYMMLSKSGRDFLKLLQNGTK